MKSLLIAGQTDVGQRRKDNQDTFICTTIWSEDSALLAAIDGVGGYAGGDRAAAIARESIERYMTTPTGDPLSMLREAVVFANNQINEQRQKESRLGQMCCVLTTALVDISAEKLYFVHVGDTRLYRYRQGVLEKLTHDHSLVGVREDARELTEAEAMQHPRRNEILREVGSTDHRVDDQDFLEWGETDFRPGDQILLCSDGLTDMIAQAQIRPILDQPLSLEEQAAQLIQLANEEGGNDNITVVLASNSRSVAESVVPLTSANVAQSPVGSPTPKRTVSLGQSAEPVRVVAPAGTQPAKRSSTGLWVMMGLILVAVIAGVVWYQSESSHNLVATTDSLNVVDSLADQQTVAVPVSSRLDSLLQAAYRSKDHRLVLPDDTLRLDTPLILTDSLQTITGGTRLTVIMPRDTAQALVAMRVTRKGLVTLENIVINGFRTGIETTNGGKLHLSNVYFRGAGLPISAAIRQDTFRNSIIDMSAQSQPVPTQTPRR